MKTLTGTQKYELELSPVTIGGQAIELFSIKRWDAIENPDSNNEEDYIASFPLWIKIWEAAFVLTEHLAKTQIASNAEILELGAGMGLTGLMLGAKGHAVTITDYNDDALDLLRKNAAHNGLENITVKKLNWHTPNLDQKFDIICGSELVYKESAMNPIIKLLKNHLKPDGVAWIAHDLKRISMMNFLKKASRTFEIKTIKKTLTGKDERFIILVHSLSFHHRTTK